MKLRVLFLLMALVACSDEKHEPPPTDGLAVFGGVAIQAATPPPPVVGGTVRIGTSSGVSYAVASDPDEDAIDVVALGAAPALVGRVSLQPGDEPNRAVFDAHGYVNVVLRRGGAIATIDPSTAKLMARRDVCAAPRGIDYDATADVLYVACADGELVTLASSGVTRVVQLDRDLRDVVVTGDTLTVTRFRSAERLHIDANGTVISRSTPTSPVSTMAPDVAWRTRNDGLGGTVMLHQLVATDPVIIVPKQSYYATTPGGVSASAVSVASSSASEALGVSQAIDLALDANSNVEALSLGGELQIGSSAVVALGAGTYYGPNDNTYQFIGIDDGSPIGIPFKVVQRRTPTAELVIFGTGFDTSLTSIALPQTASHLDTGFDIFHVPTSVGAACMTCHPEGGDDGRTWIFAVGEANEARRTQSLRGGVVTGTAPYHWSGDLPDLDALCAEVFTHRMGGAPISAAQQKILARWLDAIPRVPVTKSLDPQRVAAGATIFAGPGGCASCHVGGTGTRPDNQDIGKVDVLGASTATQVPSLLGVVDRAPYMHDGCALTLMDRFTDVSCGGSKHGETAQLSADDLASLTAFVESL
jgi:mono/diheme cytochrome c family protein